MSGFRLPKTGSRLPDYLSRCLTLNHLNTLDPIRRPLLPVCCLPPQVLGVSKDCSERDVTRAYRKQVPPPPVSVRVETNGGCYNHIRTAVPFLGTKYLEFDRYVPKTGL